MIRTIREPARKVAFISPYVLRKCGIVTFISSEKVYEQAVRKILLKCGLIMFL